jgi:ABC-type transporter Mla subunit MlaD
VPYRKIKLIVGLFVIGFTILLVSSSYFLLKEKGLFSRSFMYNFDVQSARFFSVGMPLQLSGFDIGTIENIQLKDDGWVNIRFSVKKENLKWINKETYLMIKKPLIGSPHIEVHSKLGLESLKENSNIKMLTSNDINDMIARLEPVITKLTNIIDSVERITFYLASNDSELVHILKNFDTFSGQLIQDKSLLTTITGDKNSTKNVVTALNETTTMMKELKKVVFDISKITTTLDEKIIEPSSMSAKQLELILEDIKSKLDKLDGTVDSVGSYDKELIEIKEEVSVAIGKSNQILDKVDSFMQDEDNSEVILP